MRDFSDRPSGVVAPHEGTFRPDKAEMEEASLLVCSECGYYGGRHATLCSKKGEMQSFPTDSPERRRAEGD